MTLANRRNFLFGAGAALVAPAIVRPESLMKLFMPRAELILPEAEIILPRVGGAISRAQLLKELLPGLQALFGAEYRNLPSYVDVFAE